jgi:glycosyltransferase involved in cell wall biosynthesis
MRIVHAPHAYAPALGGAENYCRGLSESLAGFGHEVYVITAGVTNAEAFYELGHSPVVPSNQQIGGVHVRRIPYATAAYRSAGYLSSRGLSHPGATRRAIGRSTRRFCDRLRAEIARMEPDVVFALPHLFPNVRCLLATVSTVPLVIAPMLHEDDPNWPFEDVRQAVARADGVVALTPNEAERLIEGYGAAPESLAVVPPGIGGVPEANQVTTGSPSPRVVYVGRRSSTKNLGLLVHAMDHVWKSIPDAQLVVAGTPGDFDVSAHVASPSEHRVGERVVTFDSPTDRELRAILRDADVVVSPSLRESFGMVILEAWSVATPVVAIDTPVSRSIVSNGRDGILVLPEAARFAEAVISVLADASLAKRMGLAGHTKVRRTYNWDRSAETLHSLYDRLT